jgi:hypothetical protein
MSVQQIRLEALARLRERRHPPEFRTWTGSDGRTIKMQVDTPAYLGATSAAEWFDDRIVGLPPVPTPAAEVVFGVAAAAREGQAAAVKALAAARALTEHDQWRVWLTLAEWQGRGDMHQAAQPVMLALMREWRRLALRGTPPDEPEYARITTVNQADLDASDARRRGW